MPRTRDAMHELGIAQSLIDAIARETRAAGAARVARAHVRVGALAGVDPEALSCCFPIAARGTPCDGAELCIVVAPADGCCPTCGARCAVHDPMDPCPGCGGWPLHLEGGRELTLASLEVV